MLKEIKTLTLRRVPPGDQWEDANEHSEIFQSLTQGLEYLFQRSEGKTTEFYLSSFKGEIYSISHEEEPDPEPEPQQKYTMYGEEL
jgi:hypothetical protein